MEEARERVKEMSVQTDERGKKEKGERERGKEHVVKETTRKDGGVRRARKNCM